MPLIDMSLQELQAYRPLLTAQPDLAEYWERSLEESGRSPLNAMLEPIEYPIDGPGFNRVWYDGWRGARICAWYIVPPGDGPFPVVVVYHGYGSSKGAIYSLLPWVSAGSWLTAGYAVLAVDTRGQSGDSTDPGPYSTGHTRGYMTQGILDPEEYYYRGAFIDCVRALDFVCSRTELDPDRIAVTGISQGGALTLAVAALDHRPKAAAARVPFLCHYRRALEVTDEMPYWEIAEYLNMHPDREEQAFRTLSYFDNLNLAPRITCPTLVTVGLQDMICPPSTVFAAYNHMSCDKQILVYPYMGHDESDAQWEHIFRWFRRHVLGR
jgi:cephalosporin-C deacetylase